MSYKPEPPSILLAADIGEVYGDRGNGLSYGWDVDNTANARWRQNDASYDLRYDTANHIMKPLPAGRVWEIGLTNGDYLVYVVAGEPSNFDEVLRLQAEGKLIVDAIPTTYAVPTCVGTPAVRFYRTVIK